MRSLTSPSLAVLVFLLSATLHPAAANPIISEFMASNTTVIADEDGDYSDWIEIYNPTTSPINLDQWCLTDDADVLAKWRFPAVSIDPGGFMLVWASTKNRINPATPLHTNFSLNAGGEYLALVQPDGTTVVSDFGAAYPPQGTDESYGRQFTSTNLIAAGQNAKYLVPANSALGTSWQSTSFSDSAWTTGPTGLGFGILVPGISARQVARTFNLFIGSTYVDSAADADSLLALAPGNSAITGDATEFISTLNYLGEGSDGHYGNNRALPTNQLNNYAIKATGFVTIPVAGQYTFGVNADDGGRIKINGTTVALDTVNHGPADRMGNINLTAGDHAFEVVSWDFFGGDEVEFYAAPGIRTVWDSGMQLVGDVANGGLAALTVPATADSIVKTNLQSVMLNINASCYLRRTFAVSNPSSFTTLSLKMRYNDGYAAFLNGTPVASRNAPGALSYNSTATAQRTNAQSTTPEPVNLTALLPSLINGNNTLAIHGLNNLASNGSFLLLPELVAGSLNAAAPSVFFGGGKSTPGGINQEFSFLGKVADTEFTVKRGIYSAPISVAISSTTPGAQIRYTTNGNDPTPTSGALYTAPLTISATTTLRAMAYLTNWQSSNIDTQTYLFPNDVLLQSSNGSPAAGWPAASGTTQILNYGMDPEIVNHANPNLGGATSVKNALLAVPSVCLTTPLHNLFNMTIPEVGGTSQGIYSNPGNRGFSWERPAHVEWIAPPDAANPNGRAEFHVSAGIRIRGGYSRSADNPKHGFHVYFRKEYGAGKLNYPLFGKGGADEYDQIDFRTAQNYSWSFGGDAQNTFLREESTRLAHLDMGHQTGRLRYFHLYINGQYWGLFNTEERTEASFSESYFGGAKDDYDVVKNEQDSGYVVGVTDGNLAAWQDLWNKSKAHLASPTNANYFKMMGRAADGVTPTADPVLLDDKNLIDYMLLTFWTGNLDGAVSSFLGNNNANNWFAARNRLGSTGGFEYFAHDFEHTFFNVNEDRTGPFNNANYSSFTYSNPMFLHQDLMANPEYRMRWADRVHRHMFNDGALTPTRWFNRINGIAAIVDQTIIAESARWGDAKTDSPLTKANWLNAQNTLLNYLPSRAPVVLAQLRADNLYPSIEAPVLSPLGGYFPSGTEVAIESPSGGLVYYMPDGSDPRAVGGAVRAGALIYTPSIVNETFIPLSAGGWKYFHTGTNLGTGWQSAAFDDSAWPVGTAELGYGDGDENASGGLIPIVDADPVTADIQKVATTYFRKSFNVTNPQTITTASVSVEYDDAVAVYLNGTYIGGNLAANPAFDLYTGTTVEDTILTFAVPPARFVNGNNVLAVEIHQTNNTSSDLSMNLSLTATRSNSTTPFYLTGGPVKPLSFRTNVSGTWSALTEATYLLDTEPASTANFAISEIMYHPEEPDANEFSLGYTNADDFEFIEFVNIGPKTIDLAGVYLYGPIDFDFNNSLLGRTLAPGARIIIASRKPAFDLRYGAGKPVAGSYKGHLNNSGEQIQLFTPYGGIIRDVTYGTLPPWPASADGDGFSLIRTAPSGVLTDDQPATAWRPSVYSGGSAGSEDAHYFSTWKYFSGAPSNNEDDEADGLNTILEYALGGDVTVMDQPRNLRIGTATFNITGTPSLYTTFTCTRRQFLSDVTLAIEFCPTLSGPWIAGQTVFVGASPQGDGSETLLFRSTDPHASPGPEGFYRLRATISP